ncbi:iap-3 [Adoxophyes orana granulovirus]|uniref:Iap-3 n=1 Tax=Adoxophyes orana granulovirus TaxID=170617 RepID=Q7T9S6_GVAO|nr:iap-3 [Adoxophyes orana granulovirus]AAP85726.1 iap-3 [Adoxophyes orana granulovirus]
MDNKNNIDMLKLSNRYKSFDNENWTLKSPASHQLSICGFYYTGNQDTTKCPYCNLEIEKWEADDDPFEEHFKFSPLCPLLMSSLNNRQPVHKKYCDENKRMLTFHNWPKALKQTPKELAEAGFFYTNVGDRVRCFYCDVGLKDWEPTDTAWGQHARWTSLCEYVLLVKGTDYVQKVLTEACMIKEEKEPKIDIQSSNDSFADSDQTCILCCDRKRDVVILECGHVIVCSNCSFSLPNCPLCRGYINKVIKIYYA